VAGDFTAAAHEVAGDFTAVAHEVVVGRHFGLVRHIQRHFPEPGRSAPYHTVPRDLTFTRPCLILARIFILPTIVIGMAMVMEQDITGAVVV
jgi:hypothetical protein